MEFYDSEDNVKQYIEMAEGFDGRELIEILKKFVPEDSSILELGMGPGVDLEILSNSYDVTGSDNSIVFLDRFRKSHPDFKLINLDITNIQCDTQFDCVYSNKVLHHLTDEALRESLLQQKSLLQDDGVLFHTFWQGKDVGEIEGMLFNYHTVDSLKKIIGDTYKIVEIEPYSEMENNDSLYIILSSENNA